MTKQLTMKEVQKVVNSPTAQLIIKALSERERDRSTTDLRRFRVALVKNGTRINLQDYYKTFKDLESVGAGRIVRGARGSLRRIEWNTSMKEIGRLGLKCVPNTPPAQVSIPKAAPAPGQVEKTVVFYLVGDKPVRIEIPGHVSNEKLKSLVEILSSNL